ncbi:MAG TPA: hypothetical protein VGD64_02865 [Acidisarcina sp.]
MRKTAGSRDGLHVVEGTNTRLSKILGLAIGVTASFLVFPSAFAGAKATPLEPAQSLARDVFYNEVQDRGQDSFWEYRIDRKTGPTSIVAEQIETKHGPIHRLLLKDNMPLTPVQEREENARLDQLLQSASDQARVQQQYEQDEARLQRLMKLMPDAFLFEYDGPQDAIAAGDFLRLKFTPNPYFKPPTFEARIFHSLTGTLMISRREKRMLHFQGQIMERVDFGWGLLGHVEKGGTFEIERRPVNGTHWKTELVDVNIEGKVVLFKTVSQHQHEVRSGFKPVPLDITLAQARAILDRVASGPSQASRRSSGSR